MLVSTKGRYGLRSMVDLAINHQDGPLPLRVIAERQEISESYLEQVFASLRKAGLVKAVRGSCGGYVLAKPASEITVEEILTALEGPMIPVSCVKDNESTPCPRMDSCLTFPLWKTLTDKISEVLSSTTLQDLADQACI
ncbi:MAG TPA: Rrf2 family transcriptional regulator [Firmicutes bacterium]|nr:Rrf2 family transcriptional regulator [Bacillota bacterium]